MAVKEIPTNTKMYYRLFIEDSKQKLKENKEAKESLNNKIKLEHDEILNDSFSYKEDFGIDLTEYEEFVNKEYSTGVFLKVAKGAFINRKNDYKLVAELYTLFEHAKDLKEVYDLNIKIKFLEKCIEISYKQYLYILKTYVTEIHKQMILNGYGYVFGQNIGWICINRIIIRNPKKILDYAATKKRKAELIAQNKRLWNKDEADWCLRNGIKYNAEDYRVFKTDEYCYEVPLIHCTLPGGNDLKLEISDYRARSVRGKTNDDLIRECNGDTSKICQLELDLKTKLNICEKLDKLLYTKFIRNEGQFSINAPASCRKNRQ